MKKWIINAIPYVLIMVGFVIGWFMIGAVGTTSRESQYYSRFQACVLSVKPSVRTDQSITNCYDRVDEETGFKGHRYEPSGF